jgi:hypothetical protein
MFDVMDTNTRRDLKKSRYGSFVVRYGIMRTRIPSNFENIRFSKHWKERCRSLLVNHSTGTVVQRSRVRVPVHKFSLPIFQIVCRFPVSFPLFVCLLVYQTFIRQRPKSEIMQNTKIDTNMNCNDTLTFSAVFSKRT